METKLNECKKLHKDTFARRQICTRAQNFTKGQNCTKTVFHGWSILHELESCIEGDFFTRVKN